MTKRRVVVALGGNAFASPSRPLTMAGQFEFARQTLRRLAPLLDLDVELLIVHGNGPQVGQAMLRVEAALGRAYALPLDVCVAASEGELGYVLEQSLYEALHERGIERSVATLLTQVVVDPDDPAFARPTKPVGAGYSADEAVRLREQGLAMVEEPGRGWRRVVASPAPVEVLERSVIGDLLRRGVVVIAAGGGGIPVVRRNGRLSGVEAVIDKDAVAALLAEQLDARLLLVLTDVDAAYEDFHRPERAAIRRATPRRLRALVAEGHFAPGSMLPKVEAAIRFASRPGRRAVICNPANLSEALQGAAGTTVEAEGEDKAATE